MSAAEELAEGSLEVFVDPVERFFKFLPRDLVDLFNRGGGVCDGVEQILPLGGEELVAFRGFFIFFERHHVDGSHGVEAGAHFAMGLVFDCQLIRR